MTTTNNNKPSHHPQTSEPERDQHLATGVELDLRMLLDTERERCPVMRNTDGSITLLAHADVRAAALDAETFSSAVSAHRALPNSLDGTEHQSYRTVIDAYFTDEEVAAQIPQCQTHAGEIISLLPRGVTVSAVHDIGTPFAVRAQATWLGWPETVEQDLVQWMSDNRDASRGGTREELAEIADRFDAIITGILDSRKNTARKSSAQNDNFPDPDDVTSRLTRDTVDGRSLEHREIVSILRNWTSGDLGSLAASVGVIVHYLASDIAIQSYLRSLVDAGKTALFEDALEEILRIDDPFVSNRRVTTRDVVVDGRNIKSGTRVHLNWTAANRDPKVFPDPDAFNPEANRANNLVFGIGPHVCPGRTLTMMELRVIIWELLDKTEHVALSADHSPVREHAPISGWTRVPIVLDPK